MDIFKRALVALDLSPMDESILRYFNFLSAFLETEKIYFIHIIPDFKAPKNVETEFQKLFSPERPIDEVLKEKLKLDIDKYFGDRRNLEISIDVREGQPYDKLIHWTEVKDVDLLAIGHKQVSEGSGITAKKVARKSNRHVLFIPGNASPALRNILVPIDLSDNSLNALNVALQLKKQFGETVRVTSLYVVDMPPDDYYMHSIKNTGYRHLLMESARIAYHNFIKQHEIDPSAIEPVFVENNYLNTAQHIQEYAENEAFDFVVLGAQGHTALENFIYGSVTEKLLERCKSKPVLIVR
jgi:nucleotide-binding universal stress UspA family protein